MASPSDLSNQEAAAAMRKQKRGPPFILLIPLIYAPVLPLIRITLRHKPILRDRLFTAVLAGAFAHGAYLVYPFVFSLCLCFFCSSPLFYAFGVLRSSVLALFLFSQEISEP